MIKATTYREYFEMINAGGTCMWRGIPPISKCCEDLFTYLGAELKTIGDQSLYDQDVQWYSEEIARIMSWSPMIDSSPGATQDLKFKELSPQVQQGLLGLFALFNILAA